MTVSVLLADDQPLLSLGLRLVLEAQPDITVVGEAGNGAQAVTMTRALRPDVVLMDVRMPVLDGIEATREIVGSGSPARILMLTTFDLDEYVYAALRAGASGFLLKDVPPAELITAIHAVVGGHAVVAPAVTRRLLDVALPHLPGKPTGDERRERLTERERQVLTLVARGLSNQEIGAELHLSEATVKAHVGRLLSKLELRDRVQIVVYAYENGLAPRTA
ncbi:response regulator [Paractinoplanes rishiriensis]|uniref:DNA-binding response regulator n=1 Tax=Paractinoplanes rishiriensis TaxID=1050105 RepID=A0A919K5S5_9ACTN|nr:response regulator transcription factor [Actinoplanes rishiriensis]GIF01432.1 DNA-binding response regulator [Actinoplanes rishiriensis]